MRYGRVVARFVVSAGLGVIVLLAVIGLTDVIAYQRGQAVFGGTRWWQRMVSPPTRITLYGTSVRTVQVPMVILSTHTDASQPMTVVLPPGYDTVLMDPASGAITAWPKDRSGHAKERP